MKAIISGQYRISSKIIRRLPVILMILTSPALAQSDKEKVLDEAITRSRDMAAISSLYPFIVRNGREESIPLISPVRDKYRISSPYGMRMHPISKRRMMHRGIDMACDRGTLVYSTASGRVISAGRNSGYGNLVEISHAYGFRTRYGHLSRIYVRPGQSVRRGQVIGFVGSTGISTGDHLHYEIIKNSKNIRPVIINR